MATTDEITDVLGYLIKLNKDRVEAYKRASYETSIADLKDIFSNMADESRKNITDLTKDILSHNRIPVTSELEGVDEIYKVWFETNSKFINRDFNTALNMCELSEEALLNCYDEANAILLNTAVIELTVRQKESLKSSLEIIKAYRKAYTRV